MNSSAPAVDAITTSEAAAVLSLKQIACVFPNALGVHDLSLDLRAGEIVALLGPSGCGKTTALRLAAGLEQLQKGHIFLKGREIASAHSSLPPEHRHVGMIFQDYALFPHLSVLDNVRFGMTTTTQNVREQRATARHLLANMGMEDFAEAFPHTLSGGQQQRVAIARAMATNPHVLLLDEPFSGLDARLRDVVRDQTLHLLKESQTAALIVTHDAEEAMYLADRIIVMDQGRVVQDGTPEILYQSPYNAFVARFFGDVNTLAGTIQQHQAHTPLGLMPAPQFDEEGMAVDILIRPEAITVSHTPSTIMGHVVAHRVLGWSSLLHIDAHSAASHSAVGGPLDVVHLHARTSSPFHSDEAAPLYVHIDPLGVHIFPRT